MSETAAVLARIVERLDAVGVAHMIAGSLASSVHGRPRTTQDIDIVIDADETSVAALVASLPRDEWYVDVDAAKDAVRRRSMFNLIDLSTGWKIDLVIRKMRTFSVEEFSRRQPHVVLGVSVQVASAEDTVVTKLEWSKSSGGSERQLRDVSGIVELKGAALDLHYIERWIAELGLEDEWARVRAGDVDG